MTWFTQRQQIAIELEAVEGTPETLVAADILHPVFDVEWGPAFNPQERNVVQDSFSRIQLVQGEKSATLSFKTELKGSGSAGVAIDPLSDALQAASWSETIVPVTSVTYLPLTEGVPSATIEVREADENGIAKIKQLVGARGTVAIEAVKGNAILLAFTFTGRYVTPTESVMLTPTPSPDALPPPFLAAAMSFHGLGTLKLQNVTLDLANNVVLRNDANQVHGNFSALISGRTPTATLDPEQELIATMDFFDRLESSTEGALTYTVGTGAGSIVTVTAPQVQISNISEADRDGIRTEALECVVNQDLDPGDDEISIAIT